MSDIYVEIVGNNDENTYIPVLKEELYIETYRSCIPSKAVFGVIKDDYIDFGEGSQVKIHIDKVPVFKGYIFTKNRNKDGIISVTAYDQLRYLKNKATYNFNGYTVSEVIKQIVADYRLECGDIDESGFVISDLTESEKTLFDIIQNAIDITYNNTGNLYILFDDFGKLSLKKAGSMTANYIAQDETAENFSYSSSIDSGVYNQIRLTLKGRKGIIQEYIKKDSDKISKWGVLQYTGSVEVGEDGVLKAQNLLDTQNKVKRRLNISGAFGDLNVRAGSIIYVRTKQTGDIEIDDKMTVEYCKHIFKNGVHTMDMSLKGGLINES